jgi:hypothetical protein
MIRPCAFIIRRHSKALMNIERVLRTGWSNVPMFPHQMGTLLEMKDEYVWVEKHMAYFDDATPDLTTEDAIEFLSHHSSRPIRFHKFAGDNPALVDHKVVKSCCRIVLKDINKNMSDTIAIPFDTRMNISEEEAATKIKACIAFLDRVAPLLRLRHLVAFIVFFNGSIAHCHCHGFRKLMAKPSLRGSLL